MLRTIILLIVTVVIVPLAAFKLDAPPSEQQWMQLTTVTACMLGVALFCFVTSTLSGNYSQVDKLWSIVPIGYVWYFAWQGMEPRVMLMAVLATLWGIRLTYNFARRGAYTWPFWAGEEDYRWSILRSGPMFNKPWKWMLFNLLFISMYQQALILAFTLPALYANVPGSAAPGITDYLLAGVFLTLLLVETVADQQQWRFQQEKHRRLKEGLPAGEYAHGFVNTGLWKWVRHPNNAAEQGIWVVFYLMGVQATGNWLNWSAGGCLLLLLLFQGSSDFSEGISASKYPEYKQYQRSTGRFLPKFW